MVVNDIENKTGAVNGYGLNLRAIKKDYAGYLNERRLNYVNRYPFLLVGEIPENESWLLHISIVKQQMDALIGALIEYFSQLGQPFTLPADSSRHGEILDGRAGYENIGKVFTICVPSSIEILSVSQKIIEISAGFNGPAIPSAVSLSGCVFISYGVILRNTLPFAGKYYSMIHGLNAHKVLCESLAMHKIKWPYPCRRPMKTEKITRLFCGQYIPVQLIKNDAKGNVIKALKLNRLYNIKWCILKQGKKYQCYDEAGRDAKDRLKWQYAIHRRLEGKVALPKVIEYFESGEDGYLSMDFIEACSFGEKIIQLQQGSLWSVLPSTIKREMIHYLLQIIAIIESFHKLGLLHRDITPGNFLTGPDRRVTAIDIELCYDSHTNTPSPAYALGTTGYMSPQQQKQEKPVVADDIYSLGALMVKALTGISPGKFQTDNDQQRKDSLGFFIESASLVAIMVDCLNTDRSSRPDLVKIRHALEIYDATLLTTEINTVIVPFYPVKIQTSQLIQSALNGLIEGNKQMGEYAWLSRSMESSDILASEMMNFRSYPGFHTGTAGIICVLSVAGTFGYDIRSLAPAIKYNLQALEGSLINDATQPGLWHGSYGIAFLFSTLTKTGLQLLDEGIAKIIWQQLNLPATSLNIAEGSAGLGLCLLYAKNCLTPEQLHGQLSLIIQSLRNSQEKDGSWLISKDREQSASVKLTGFAFGTAGIVFFLLQYLVWSADPNVEAVVKKALSWLVDQRKPRDGQFVWEVSTDNPIIDPWLEHGFSGVALAFIKAYEVFGDDRYKKVAESALLSHPKYIASNLLTVESGLAGLGEVYLEAFKIFRNSEWQERASHIANFFKHTAKTRKDNSIYWLDDNYTIPTADFLSGNCGIIHFLIRYNHPDETGFPFLTNL